MNKKKLVIIAGITGAIGTALLEQYGSKKNTVVFGISRRARKVEDFIDPKTGKIYAATLICSLSQISEGCCDDFVSLIDFEKFSEITYIHCIGTYLFEIDKDGHFIVSNDKDKDGINDECMMLSYNLFQWMTKPLIARTKTRISCVIFGGLPDKHRPRIIQSWWKTMILVEEYMKNIADKRVGMHVFNISSVLCPHELMTRPYVFVNTEADPQAWLLSSQLAKLVRKKLCREKGGYYKSDIFNPWAGFFSEFYLDEHMVPTKLAEVQKK